MGAKVLPVRRRGGGVDALGLGGGSGGVDALGQGGGGGGVDALGQGRGSDRVDALGWGARRRRRWASAELGQLLWQVRAVCTGR